MTSSHSVEAGRGEGADDSVFTRRNSYARTEKYGYAPLLRKYIILSDKGVSEDAAISLN